MKPITASEVRDALIASETLEWRPLVMVHYYAGESVLLPHGDAYKRESVVWAIGRRLANVVLIPVQVLMGAFVGWIPHERDEVAADVLLSPGDELPPSRSGPPRETWLAFGATHQAIVLAERVTEGGESRVFTLVAWQGVLADVQARRGSPGRDVLRLIFHDGSAARLIVPRGSATAIRRVQRGKVNS